MTQTKIASQKINTLLSLSTVVIGLILMTFMVTVESEPGAIPLFLILSGTIWYFIARTRTRSKSTR